ncbi:hypothetical protein D3C87_1573700 [compost metagenome]
MGNASLASAHSHFMKHFFNQLPDRNGFRYFKVYGCLSVEHPAWGFFVIISIILVDQLFTQGGFPRA